jgi:hypothetical protein
MEIGGHPEETDTGAGEDAQPPEQPAIARKVIQAQRVRMFGSPPPNRSFF